mgnify:FL=1
MARFISSVCRYFVGGYDLGSATTQAKITLSTEALDVTAFGQSAERVSTAGALRKDSIDWAGFFADGIQSPDAYLAGSLGTVGDVVTFAIGTTTGDRAYCGTVLSEKVGVGGEVRGLVRYEATWRPDNTLDRCRHMGVPLTGTTGAGMPGSIDDDAASTGTGAAYFHVLAYTGTLSNLNLVLIHSTDGTTFSTKATADFTGTGSKRTEFTGTLNRYVDTDANFTGSVGGPTATWFIAYKRP